MIALLQQALENRSGLLDQLHNENTDCYRLFHGTNEGCSGLTVDRYGPQLLMQTFHQPISQSDAEQIQQVVEEQLGKSLQLVYNDRSQKNSRRSDEQRIDGQE